METFNLVLICHQMGRYMDFTGVCKVLMTLRRDSGSERPWKWFVVSSSGVKKEIGETLKPQCSDFFERFQDVLRIWNLAYDVNTQYHSNMDSRILCVVSLPCLNSAKTSMSAADSLCFRGRSRLSFKARWMIFISRYLNENRPYRYPRVSP